MQLRNPAISSDTPFASHSIRLTTKMLPGDKSYVICLKKFANKYFIVMLFPP